MPRPSPSLAEYLAYLMNAYARLAMLDRELGPERLGKIMRRMDE